MKVVKILLKITIFFILTIFTQIGGLIYLISFRINKIIDKKIDNEKYRRLAKPLTFLTMYFIATFAIVPLIAKPFGRVRLPMTESNHLQPLNIMTCILNRNYVRPELRDAAFNIANKMNEKYPSTVINYLDANFPFINKFPLLPHLSHNDGRKLDLSFCYIDNNSQSETNEAPSFIGYGICEEPRPNEENKPEFCSQNGYWQYNFLKQIVPQGSKKDYSFDERRTKTLIELILAEKCLEKLFIEPHLKTRLGFTSNKIRFQGCRAVRHDDHIHLQCY